MKQRNIILGFIGACAACCAIPLAAPLFGSAAISAAIVGLGETAERGLAFGAAAFLAFMAWRGWRSRLGPLQDAGAACGCGPAQENDHTHTVAPIACTLTPDDFKQRAVWIRGLAQDALQQARRDDLTLYLTYARSAAPRVNDMIRKEKSCCPFLRFDLHEDASGIHLTIAAPEDARAAAEDLFAHFAPEFASSKTSNTQEETV
jgi:hypothetical protein